MWQWKATRVRTPELRAESMEQSPSSSKNSVQPSMCVTLGQIAHLVVHAALKQRCWLEDFADEPMMISADLHELLATVQQIGNKPEVQAS